MSYSRLKQSIAAAGGLALWSVCWFRSAKLIYIETVSTEMGDRVRVQFHFLVTDTYFGI